MAFSTGLSLLMINASGEVPTYVGPPSITITGWNPAPDPFYSGVGTSSASDITPYSIVINNNGAYPSASGIQSCTVQFVNTRGTATSSFNANPTTNLTNHAILTSTGSYYGQIRLAVVADGVTFYSPYRELRLAANYAPSISYATTTMTSPVARAVTASPNPDPWGETGYSSNAYGSAAKPVVTLTSSDFTYSSSGSWPNFSFTPYLRGDRIGTYTANVDVITVRDFAGASGVSNQTNIPLSMTRNLTWPLAASYTATGIVSGDKVRITTSVGSSAPFNIGISVGAVGVGAPTYGTGNVTTMGDLFSMGSLYEVSYSNASGSSAWVMTAGSKGVFYNFNSTNRPEMTKTATSTTYGISITVRLISDPTKTMTNVVSITV